MSDSTKAFDDFDALGLIDILPANGRAVVGAAWVICWQASRSQALEEAAVLAHDAWENGGGSESSELPNAIRALKEQV